MQSISYPVGTEYSKAGYTGGQLVGGEAGRLWYLSPCISGESGAMPHTQ